MTTAMLRPRAEITAEYVANQPAETARRAMAIRLAKACRRVVQACLREEEWADADADAEFARIILTGLEELDAAREEVICPKD